MGVANCDAVSLYTRVYILNLSLTRNIFKKIIDDDQTNRCLIDRYSLFPPIWSVSSVRVRLIHSHLARMIFLNNNTIIIMTLKRPFINYK